MKTILKKLFFPHSLRAQLLTRTLFILAFILLVIGLVQYWVMKDFLYRNEAQTLSTRMMSLQKNIGLNGQAGPIDHKPGNKDDNGPPPDHKFFFLQDMSLAFIDQYGNYKDLLGKTSIQAPQLSK